MIEDYLVPTLRVGTHIFAALRPTPKSAERTRVCSHAERGNEVGTLVIERWSFWLAHFLKLGKDIRVSKNLANTASNGSLVRTCM